jgi:hypothetical protein
LTTPSRSSSTSLGTDRVTATGKALVKLTSKSHRKHDDIKTWALIFTDKVIIMRIVAGEGHDVLRQPIVIL